MRTGGSSRTCTRSGRIAPTAGSPLTSTWSASNRQSIFAPSTCKRDPRRGTAHGLCEPCQRTRSVVCSIRGREHRRCIARMQRTRQRRSAMKVKDAMHKGVDWVSPDTPVTELAKLMREHDIGAIPIGENDRLVGMVTDRDIVCKGLAQDGFDAGAATARDVMTPGIHCCRDDDDLAKAVRHMEELKVRRLAVINKSKRMVGI